MSQDDGQFPTLINLTREATQKAASASHGYITIEDFMLAVLEQPSIMSTMKEMQVDTAKIIQNVQNVSNSQYGSQNRNNKKLEDQLDFTAPCKNFIQTLRLNAEAVSKQDVSPFDCLLLLMETRADSATFYFLKEASFTAERLKSYLSEHPELLETGFVGDATVFDGENRKTANQISFKNQFVTCLNEKVGEFDDLIGREVELDRLAQIMARRRKNHALIIGEPGVGKTALMEGLAQRIVNGKVPRSLMNRLVFSLDIVGLMIGAKARGDFEERMRVLLNALAKIGGILFIDNVASLLGSTSQQTGTVDAASLLRPYMAQNKVKIIISANYEEKRNVLDKDKGFLRLFQIIDLHEPSKDQVRLILNNALHRFAAHHAVTYDDDAIEAAIELSGRYIPDRSFPDKALDLLDEAGARLSAGLGAEHETSVNRLLLEKITGQIVKIEVGSGTLKEKDRLKDLAQKLKSVIFGQELAIDTVAKAVLLSKAGLNDPDHPLGSFLFVGPTGVGKTELTKQLATNLGWALHRYDMSEYMEHHSVSKFIGSPPGYVGHDQGSALFTQLSKSPQAVVLLDEIEKAHPDILNLLLQAMDNGMITDGRGQKIDFRQVVLIMTSNLGADSANKNAVGFQTNQDTYQAESRERAITSGLTPEFRNRLDAIVNFTPLQPAQMGLIVSKHVAEINTRLAEKKVSVELSVEAAHWLAKNGFDPKMGARPLKRLIKDKVSVPMAESILYGALENGGVWRVVLINDQIVGSALTESENILVSIEIPQTSKMLFESGK